MSTECQLEKGICVRIHILREELEHSLRGNIPQQPREEKCRRPLNMLFRNDKMAQIQIGVSSPTSADAAQTAPPVRPIASTRFSVSPTPNAPLPAAIANSPPNGLRVLISQPKVADASSVSAATSPASSVDSGVASPGPGDFSPPPFFPSWATLPPRSCRRRIFTFGPANGNASDSLIAALALSGGKGEQRSWPPAKSGPADGTHLALQKPPARKKKAESESAADKVQTNLLLSAFSPPAMLRQLSEGSAQSTAAAAAADTQSPGTALPQRMCLLSPLPPLKGILKKPKTATMEGQRPGGNLPSSMPRNHQRRTPTRLLLSRSMSEELANLPAFQDTAVAFNKAIIQQQQEQQRGKQGMANEAVDQLWPGGINKSHSSSSSSSSASISNGSLDGIDDVEMLEAATPISKKRVSFSEQVHARIYRSGSNSSIGDQRRKNEKKVRQRANKRFSLDEPAEEELDLMENGGAGFTISSKQSPPLWRARGSAAAASIFSSPHSVVGSPAVLLAR